MRCRDADLVCLTSTDRLPPGRPAARRVVDDDRPGTAQRANEGMGERRSRIRGAFRQPLDVTSRVRDAGGGALHVDAELKGNRVVGTAALPDRDGRIDGLEIEMRVRSSGSAARVASIRLSDSVRG